MSAGTTPVPRILVVDDERVALRNLLYLLEKEGYAVIGAESGAVALQRLQGEVFDLVITDLRMERVDGMQILRFCREKRPETAVILVTGHATVSSAVDAMREGAFHYIAKPYRIDEVRHLVREALALTRLRRENARLRELVASFGEGERLLTQDAALRKILETARQIAGSDANVIISGESGTGKELLARFIHEHSRRREGPFVAVNCGAFPEDLLANELFGHVKGAYTGAADAREGLIEAAGGGTLFLDELTEMSPAMQVKLLRVIQERELMRLGSSRPVRVDVRFLAATNRDLREAVASGRLRQDLYFRLNVVNLHLPPLSARPGDVPLLAHHFLRRFAARLGKVVTDFDPQALALLAAYEFPGNVRELANLIERGVALADGGVLRSEHLPDDLRRLKVRAIRPSGPELPTLEEQELTYIRWVLEQTNGNKSQAAAILGIDRVSLWRKLKKYDLDA